MTLRPAGFGIVLLSFILSSVPGDARAWTWLPEGRTTLVPIADPREPSLGFDAIEGGFWSARIGAAVTVGRAGAGADSSGLEIGVDGFAWLWFSALPDFNFPLETVDGSFGFWAGQSHDRFAWRARLSHWSGHLGDGAADIEETRIVYSRESITLLGAWDANPHLRLHGGPGFFYRAHPRTQAFQFQAGGELRPDLNVLSPGRRVDPYLAVDLRMKAENEYRVNQSYQAGVRLTDGQRALRIHLGYAAGVSERGQEWRASESYVSLGVTFGD
jgi:hypothetical protein